MKLLRGFIFSLLMLPAAAWSNEASPCEGNVQLQKNTIKLIIEASRQYFKDTGKFPDSQYDLKSYIDPFPKNLHHDFVMFDPIEHKVMLYCGFATEESETETRNIQCNGGLYSKDIKCAKNAFHVIRTEWEPS